MIVGKEITRSRAVEFIRDSAARRRMMRTALASKFVLPIALSIALLSGAASYAIAGEEGDINVWWPTNGAHVSGTQPFKAMAEDWDVSEYEMFWQVDGGQWNWMDNNDTDYPHKEVNVDLTSWDWRGSGPYEVTFIVRKDGVVSERSIDVYVDNDQSSESSDTEESSKLDNNEEQENSSEQKSDESEEHAQGSDESDEDADKNSTTADSSEEDPLDQQNEGILSSVELQKNRMLTPLNSSGPLYVNSSSPAARQADEWRASRPDDAQMMDILASAPTAVWLGGWSGNIESAARSVAKDATREGATATFVAYNIPGRDCGGYSAGGVSSKNEYTSWIGGLSRGIGDASAIVILEPDALAGLDCLSEQDKDIRMDMLSSAVSILKSNSNTRVYIDAGHSSWTDADTMAARLQRSNISRADGFALNVSNYNRTDDEQRYGEQLSEKLGGEHFVIDTSRNGNGGNGQWCNPAGRKVGKFPTLDTGNSRIDGYLWLKTPGESDGYCNGGPSAGAWWPDYALGLVR